MESRWLPPIEASTGPACLEVVSYFRRKRALHARCQVLARLRGEAWDESDYGRLTTVVLPLSGGGVHRTGQLLSALGQHDLDLDPNDDRAISYAIGHRPFIADLVLSRPVQGTTTVRRFVNMVNPRSITSMSEMPRHVWERPAIPSGGIARADTRRAGGSDLRG